MKVKEYLNMEQELLISHLTLNEADQGLIDPLIYYNIYEYFMEDKKNATHMLTYGNNNDILLNELCILVEDEIDGAAAIEENNLPKLQVHYEVNKLILTVNVNQKFNNNKYKIVLDLKEKQVSLAIAQLLKQKNLDIHFISKQDNKLCKIGTVNIYIPGKMKTVIVDFLEVFLNCYNIKTQETIDNLDDILIENQSDYLRVVISKKDIIEENVLKYENMLKTLYPNVLLTHILCERLDIYIEGYEEDPRELWQIPEVRSFIKQLASKFNQLFYFLDKSTEALYWITMCICCKGFCDEERYKMNTLEFNDFMNDQFKNLGEISYYLNNHKAFEEVKENVFTYYKYFGCL